MEKKREQVCVDLPIGEAFRALLDHPDAQVVGRLKQWRDKKGEEWTALDPGGDWGYRLMWYV